MRPSSIDIDRVVDRKARDVAGHRLDVGEVDLALAMRVEHELGNFAARGQPVAAEIAAAAPGAHPGLIVMPALPSSASITASTSRSSSA